MGHAFEKRETISDVFWKDNGTPGWRPDRQQWWHHPPYIIKYYELYNSLSFTLLHLASSAIHYPEVLTCLIILQKKIVWFLFAEVLLKKSKKKWTDTGYLLKGRHLWFLIWFSPLLPGLVWWYHRLSDRTWCSSNRNKKPSTFLLHVSNGIGRGEVKRDPIPSYFLSLADSPPGTMGWQLSVVCLSVVVVVVVVVSIMKYLLNFHSDCFEILSVDFLWPS